MDKVFPIVLFLLSVFSLAFAEGSQQGRKTLFLEPTADSVSEYDRNILADRIRTELSAAGLSVIQKAEMYSSLGMEKVRLLEQCPDDPCKLKLVLPLGATLVLGGAIKRRDDGYEIIIFQLNARGKDENASGKAFEQGTLQAVADTGPKRAVAEILLSIARIEKQSAARGKFADLFVSTSTPGAQVFVDSVATGKQTPCTIKAISAGTHIIETRSAESHGSVGIFLEPAGLQKLEVPMMRGKCRLIIYSTPAEASVYIGNALLGKTPLRIDGLDAGDHLLRITKNFFGTVNHRVFIGMNDSAVISDSLLPCSYLSVTSTPSTARVLINKVVVGKGLIDRREFIPMPELSLRIEAEGYEPFDTLFGINQNSEVSISKALISKFATIKIRSEPTGAAVLIDGDTLGNTPLVAANIQPGSRVLQIVKPTYATIQMPVVCEKNAVYERSFILHHSDLYSDSLADVAKKRKHAVVVGFRVSTGVLSLACFGAAIGYQAAVLRCINDENRIQQEYDRQSTLGFDAVQYEAHFSAVKNQEERNAVGRNVFIVLGSASIALCGFTFFF